MYGDDGIVVCKHTHSFSYLCTHTGMEIINRRVFICKTLSTFQHVPPEPTDITVRTDVTARMELYVTPSRGHVTAKPVTRD